MKKRIFLFATFLAMAFSAGCTTTAMKGTPFYTGEHTKGRGDAGERVNIWPLLYYREPALSVLWPLLELSDEHFALRPLISYYGRGTDDRDISVLWPLGSFKPDKQKYRFFPFFWGDDYVVGFPLFYHFDDPFAGDGSSVLFPLWIYNDSTAGKDLHLMWPILNYRHKTHIKGGRLWPLYGSYERSNGSAYRFFAWPLGHAWRTDDRSRYGSALLPLYWYSETPAESRFLSLPYSHVKKADGDFWRLIMPLVYTYKDNLAEGWLTLLGGVRREGSRFKSFFLPTLSSYESDENGHDLKGLLGLMRHKRDDDETVSRLFPLYSYGRDLQSSHFYSLPFSRRTHENGDSWTLVPPLFYSEKSVRGDSRFISLFYSRGERADGSAWTLAPLLYASRDAEGGSRFLSPLYSQGEHADGSSWKLAPLFYAGQDSAGNKRVVSPLYAHGKNVDGSSWRLVPPLWYAQEDADGGSMRLSLLYSDRRRADGSVAWRSIFPLVYSRDDPDDCLVATLLGGWRSRRTRRDWLALPLLAGGEHDVGFNRLWYLAGLGRAEWGDQSEGKSWLFPLYYRNKRAGTFFSLLYGHRQDGEWREHYLPGLLSRWKHRPGETRLDALLGLGHASWGERSEGKSWLFPLFYHHPGRDVFLSLPYMDIGSESHKVGVVPPLLSWWTRDGGHFRLRAFAGLSGFDREEGDISSSYLLPLYAHKKGQYFLTLLYGHDNSRNGYTYFATPLAGVWRGERSGGWLFPLWSRLQRHDGSVSGNFLWGVYSSTPDGHASASMFPFFGYSKYEPVDQSGNYSRAYSKFFCLPICWKNYEQSAWRSEEGEKTKSLTVKTGGVFPLFSSKTASEVDSRGEKIRSKWNVLLRLVDYRAEQDAGGDAKDAYEEHSYSRLRILWRLYHRETLNGATTTDIFPAITYDRSADGRKSWSFLWRLAGYKHREDGSKTAYFLFIPIKVADSK